MNHTDLRGSIWRRWDLHLHTPETKKNSNFDGSSIEEQWDNFYQTIQNYVDDGSDPLKAVSVIGIADYLSLDNYFKVKNAKRLPECVKLLIPNIEARMTPIAKDSPINIHFLFDPSFDSQIESQFLANLYFKTSKDKFYATRPELIRLGREHTRNPHLSEEAAYKEGIEQFVLEPESIREVLKDKQELRNKVLIIVSNSSGDGASGARAHSDYLTSGGDSQLGETIDSIYQLADFVFSSNFSDREYFLGLSKESEEVILKRYGSLLPCIHGCDAHDNKKIFAPDGERFCWIKSDPTFEGLKQVLYEPQDRVFIGNTYPSLKSGYNTIGRVEVYGNDFFSSEPIYFSENLTCIIGGKSTGKSLLLHNMALALDKEQAAEKTNKSGTKIQKIPELKVCWRDGYETLSSLKDTEEVERRKIIYIPQTYLNKLSDEQEETTEIDAIIQDIILQNEDSYEDHRAMESSLLEKAEETTRLILALISTHQEIARIHAERMEKGDEKGVGAEITKLETQLSELSKSYELSEQDISTYQKSVELTQRHTRVIKALDVTREKLKNTDSIIENTLIGAEDFLTFKEQISDAINLTIHSANKIWSDQRDKIITSIDEVTTDSKEKLAVSEAVVKKLQPKISGHGQISQLSSLITSEKQKLTSIEELTEKIKVQTNSFEETLQNLCNKFFEFQKIQDDYSQKINTRLSEVPSDDLEFRVEVVFRSEHFKQSLARILNNRSFAHFSLKEALTSPSEDNITIEFLKELIRSILSVAQQRLSLKNEYDIESGLREIFINWYNINYIVKLDNDDIYDMSPGKKALVLLRLLISLAESKCPILIDQPEDDLDNRSIFGELIEFIKKRKIDRQIIIVTHNANIVVGSDAELVIVANQHGKNSPNAKYRFEYRAGSIENNYPLPLGEGTQTQGVLERQGIQGHICDILEGGLAAFALRGKKYRSLKNSPQ